MTDDEFWILTAAVVGFIVAVLIFVPRRLRHLAAALVFVAYGGVLLWFGQLCLAVGAGAVALTVVAAKLRR